MKDLHLEIYLGNQDYDYKHISSVKKAEDSHININGTFEKIFFLVLPNRDNAYIEVSTKIMTEK